MNFFHVLLFVVSVVGLFYLYRGGGIEDDVMGRRRNGYCRMTKHILLLIFTFGIWYFIWVYRTTKYLNCVRPAEQRKPISTFLLCLFLPYNIYWTYKTAQLIDGYAKEKGIVSNITMPCLILAILIGIVPPIIMQDKINDIVTNSGQKIVNTTSTIVTGMADELKKYKDLLDDGVISQEEFDAQKNKILGK